jgi:hypothetical protein
MNVVGRHHIVEHRETESLLCFKDPVQISATIAYSETPNYRFSFLNLLTIGTTGTERSGGTFGTILFLLLPPPGACVFDQKMNVWLDVAM